MNVAETTDTYNQWASFVFPFDAAECGFCLSQHGSNLCCTRRDHDILRKAAQDEELVKLVGKLRKTTYAPRIAEIRKTFLRIRKKYARYWK